MIIPYCHCGKPVENKDTGLCASCAAAIRKAEKTKAKELPTPIAQISARRAKENQIYTQNRKKILLNSWCAYHGKPCLPTEIHHVRGRVGVNENGEPILYDVRYMLPVCRDAHDYIESHPKEAKDKGWSESRLTDIK